jgi:hypothetical protein
VGVNKIHGALAIAIMEGGRDYEAAGLPPYYLFAKPSKESG